MRKLATLIVSGVLTATAFAGIATYASAEVQEDSITFNCHVHGNGVCGSTPGPLGFSNLD